MNSVNKVILIGYLGNDPEIKVLNENTKLAKFNLATTETYKKDDDYINKTEWHKVVAWNGLASVAEKILQKGKQVYIEGSLTTKSWDDKDGNKKYMTQIVASDIKLLSKNNKDVQPKIEELENNNDLPF